MHIIFNNSSQQIAEESSIQGIINELIGDKQAGIAVAVNETVISKADWNKHLLKDNDNVLVIKATPGG